MKNEEYVKFKANGDYPCLGGQIGQVVDVKPSRWGDSESEISVNVVASMDAERFVWITNASCLDIISREAFTETYMNILAQCWRNRPQQER